MSHHVLIMSLWCVHEIPMICPLVNHFFKYPYISSRLMSMSITIDYTHYIIPSSKLTELWTITISNGQIHYKSAFSIANCLFTRPGMISLMISLRIHPKWRLAALRQQHPLSGDLQHGDGWFHPQYTLGTCFFGEMGKQWGSPTKLKMNNQQWFFGKWACSGI